MPNLSVGFRSLGLATLPAVLALFGRPALAQAQTGEIRGRIATTAKTAPAIGSSAIRLEGTSIRATPDSTGAFIIPNVPTGTYTLVVMLVSSDSYRRAVTVDAGRVTEVAIDRKSTRLNSS